MHQIGMVLYSSSTNKKKSMNFKIPTLIALITATTFFVACNKDETGNSTLNVRLTDAPAAMDSVFVDIREVRVKMTSDSSNSNNDGWITLSTNAGIYNLLELQNGNDTLLGTASIPTGTVKQLRFILGDQNRVVVSDTSYPLIIPSGSESGLKINLSKDLRASLETLVIDFDAALSIRRENDGTYKLRPVLRVR